MRPIAECLPTTLDLSKIFELRMGFLRQTQATLNTHEANLCLDKVFWYHELNHIPEFCLSTPSVNHTINDFRGNHNTFENHSLIIFP